MRITVIRCRIYRISQKKKQGGCLWPGNLCTQNGAAVLPHTLEQDARLVGTLKTKDTIWNNNQLLCSMANARSCIRT